MAQRRGHNAKTDSISQFLCPENGYRGNLQKRGIQPKDHMKENLRDLRQSQNRMREQKEEALRPQKELYKLSQFKGVQAKVFQSEPNIRRPSFDNREFLSKGVSEKRREELANENKLARVELEKKMEEADRKSVV